MWKNIVDDGLTVISDTARGTISKASEQFLEMQAEKLSEKGATLQTATDSNDKSVESDEPKEQAEKSDSEKKKEKNGNPHVVPILGLIAVGLIAVYILQDGGRRPRK